MRADSLRPSRIFSKKEPESVPGRSSAKSLTQLLTTLRATPHSRMQPHIAGQQMAKVRTVRPWETVEEASDN
jgi:hypothetical protein